MSRLAGIAQIVRRRDLPLLPLAIGAVLLVLLAVLAALQYRWIGQVSVMERQRMQASLATAAGHFTEDFDREVTRAFLYFHPEPDVQPAERPERAVRQYERWLAEAPEPGLVRDLLLVTRSGGDLRLAQLRPRGKAFEPTAWTADLEPLRRRLAALAPISLPADLPPSPPLAADVPGLVFPLDLPPFGEPGRPRSLPEVREHLVVRFDNQALVSTVLPALSRRYFGAPAGAGYAVSVVPVDDPRRVLFRSDPDLSAAAAPDLRLVMFRLRPFEELRGLWSGGQRTPGRHPFRGPGAHFRQGAWWLLVKHRNGSL
ncbi:MAG TPA: hypothetical protein VOA87_20645, partial [Thermoanaerobaculia bacterium]|nr:hypothetical protein [Thermoanaerobaculia bacterium]